MSTGDKAHLRRHRLVPPTDGLKWQKRADTSIAEVAKNALKEFTEVINPLAVRIITPFPERVSLNECSLNPGLCQIIKAYEPEAVTGGLYRHQANFLEAFALHNEGDFIMTTATGTGKSLCFWAWVFDCLLKDPRATALLCFPTQALMWGQADRMARISAQNSLCFPTGSETAYGGRLAVGGRAIGWTIWYGTRGNAQMKEQEGSDAFAASRIRIATLDKAYLSLFSSKANKEFASHLRRLVLDEAHTYHGIFGANVHYFLKRLYFGSCVKGRKRPNLFLASATLSGSPEFAANLLSLDPAKITHIQDSTKQRVSLVEAKELPKLLRKESGNGLSRFVLLLDEPANGHRLADFLRENDPLGSIVKAIYFTRDKYGGKILARRLNQTGQEREALVYDADLPPAERRKLEKRLNDPASVGITVIGTSALELGVDIQDLDVCLLDRTPPRRVDLLQRIGRVGRRAGKHGLVLLRLSAEPHDREMLSNPARSFQLNFAQTLPIPLHLEWLKLRAMLAAFQDWKRDLDYGAADWDLFNQAMQVHFGVERPPSRSELKEQFTKSYGQLIDMTDQYWVYQGFRASAGTDKIPLLYRGNEVARIGNEVIFRDAHPGAIYLGHDGNRYRVVDYDGRFKRAKWENPKSDWLLGRWLKDVESIVVTPEHAQITTRGSWRDRYSFWMSEELAQHLEAARKGSFKFGIWDFERSWNGFTEIDLQGLTCRKVTLEAATRAFGDSMEAGRKHPFLFPLAYRTRGWQWNCARMACCHGDNEALGSLSLMVKDLLKHFLAAAVESSPDDLHVEFSLKTHLLVVLDNAPGGNGLSEALLGAQRMPQALKRLGAEVENYSGKSARKTSAFKEYLLALGVGSLEHSAEEILDVLRELQVRWTG